MRQTLLQQDIKAELVWCVILYTILSSVIFGFVIAKSKPSQRKFWYSFGLIFGGLGLISMFFIHNQWLLIISFIFIGINNLTMNTQPFTLLKQLMEKIQCLSRFI